MAKPTTTVIEPHILIETSYPNHVAIPTSLASQVLPYLRVMQRDYVDGEYRVSVPDKVDTPIRLISAEEMTAALVAHRLKGG